MNNNISYNNVVPLFSTSASRKGGGIFTIDKAGSAAESKKFKGPINLVDLAKEEDLKQITLVESNFVNFMVAQKYFDKIGCQFRYGLKIVVCEDMAQKDENSIKNESKVIIFLKDDAGYKKLCKIFTNASNEGFYYVPRISWSYLNDNLDDNLILALPFYSSFIAKNLLTFSSIIPIVNNPLVLREVGQDLPFDNLINKAIDNYGGQIQNVKTIYYKNRKDSKQFLIYRAILERETWDAPNIDHMSSKEFSWESYKNLINNNK